MNLEKVTHDIIQQTADLAHKIWNQHFPPIIGQEQVDYMVRNLQSSEAIANQIKDGYEYFLMSDENLKIGYLAIKADLEKSKMMISKLYLDSSARGADHGKFMLDFVVNECRERGINTIWLTVNRHNSGPIEWYKRRGFVVTEEKKMDIGNGFFMDDFIMEYRVNNNL